MSSNVPSTGPEGDDVVDSYFVEGSDLNEGEESDPSKRVERLERTIDELREQMKELMGLVKNTAAKPEEEHVDEHATAPHVEPAHHAPHADLGTHTHPDHGGHDGDGHARPEKFWKRQVLRAKSFGKISWKNKGSIGAGAALGTLMLPGFGTIIGAAVGPLAKKLFSSDTASKSGGHDAHGGH